MTIADYIAEIIQKSLTHEEHQQLGQAFTTLSHRYREGSYNKAPLSLLERYAYIFARCPATIAALSAVLKELKERVLDFAPRSMIDIGAGPATASWAAIEYFDSLMSVTLVEKDLEWIKLGKKLALHNPRLRDASWLQHNLDRPLELSPADLIVASYSFQELALDKQARLVTELFHKTVKALVIIEPGTVRGFANIKALREVLLREGAHIIAPCPHHLPCPLQSSRWCHFSERLYRHEFHRRIKAASMGYEDEKYSYLIVSPNPVVPLHARVIGTPQKRSGHIILDLCSEGENRREIIAQSKKNLYKQAKKFVWGSPYTLEPQQRTDEPISSLLPLSES